MWITRFGGAVLIAGVCAAVSTAGTTAPVRAAFGSLPLIFEQNAGQTAPGVDFLARGPASTVFLTRTGATVRLPGGDVRIGLLGAGRSAQVQGLSPLGVRSHYLLGSRTLAAPSFRRVQYSGVYQGVDLVYYGKGRELEFDFVVAPGADPGLVRLAFEGVLDTSIDPDGRLRLHTACGDLWLGRPRVYQRQDGREREIAGELVLLGPNRAGFRLGAYDRSLPVVIDPVLIYSTYLGGTAFDSVTAIAVDGTGSAYVAGWTESLDLPTEHPIQGHAGGVDAFVAKLNPAGTGLVYCTYLGGVGDDRAFGLAVGQDGSAVVTGWTYSADFPLASPAQGTLGGGRDAFLAKLNPAGDALVFSTFFGGAGSDSANGIALDSDGGIYIGGETDSTDLPTRSAYQSSNRGLTDGFLAKLTPAGALAYSTYLGGAGRDRIAAIAVDGLGQAYVTGATESLNFPTLGALQTASGGLQDAFVVKLNAAGSGLMYSTYLGGSGGSVLFPESGLGIAVDLSGNAYVTGVTSSANFPSQNPLRACTLLGGGLDAFVSKLNPWGSGLVYGTCLGGANSDYGLAIAVDPAGDATVAGYTNSADFPLANPIQAQSAGLYDAFVATLAPAGDSLLFSTYLGGAGSDSAQSVALDSAGAIYVAGQTQSNDFPLQGAMQTQNGGTYGGFVARIRSQPCSYLVDPVGPLTISSLGASGSLSVTTEPDCQWNASSDSSWITLPGAASGGGNGAVPYSVDPNETHVERSGALSVAAHTVAITQAAAAVAGFTGSQFSFINTSHGLVNNQVSSMVADSAGVLYVTTGYFYLAGATIAGGGVSRWDHRVFANLTTAQGLASNTVQSSLYDPSTNLVWFGTDNGISRYNAGTGAFLATLLPGVKVASLKRDAAGSIWVGTYGNGVYRFTAAGAQSAQYTYTSTGGGLVDDRVTSLAIDGANNLWVGTDRGAAGGSNFNRGGLSRFAIGSAAWTGFDLNQGAGSPPAPLVADGNRIFSLAVDASNNVWMAIPGNGAVRRTPAGVISSFRYDSTPPCGGNTANIAYAVYRDAANNIWFGWGGYGDIASPRKVAATLLPASEVNATTPAFQNYNKDTDGFPSNLVISFYAESATAMWFGFQGGGMARLGGPPVVSGWPQTLSSWVYFSSPVLADLEGLGKLDIVVGDSAGVLHAYRPDGSVLWSFDTRNAFAPGVAGAESIQSSPAIGDVDGDGELEVVVGLSGQYLNLGAAQGGVLILSRTGALKRVLHTYDITDAATRSTIQDGYAEPVFAAPVLANVDKDPELEILAGAFDNLFYAWNGDGTPIYARDKDGDRRFGEDPPGDYTPNTPMDPSDDAPGIKGADDDGNGEVDEGNTSDDDEDGWIDEDTPGWPLITGDTTVGAAVVGDLLGDGQPAIIFGHDFYGGAGQPFGHGGVLRGLRPDGGVLPGFPKHDLEEMIWSSPVLADLDGDGALEIVHGSGLDMSGIGDTPAEQLIGQLVYAWRRDGSSFIAGNNGRLATTQGRSWASFAVGDIDNNGQPELVIATSSLRDKWGRLIDASGNPVADANAVGQMLYAFRSNGTVMPGFPVRPYPRSPGANLIGSPVLADVDGDGYLDIIVPVAGGLIVFDRAGRVLPGMGVFEALQDTTYSGEMSSTPAVGDIDGDGNLELVWANGTGNNTGGALRVVRLGPVNSTVQRSWPMFLRAPNRNGLFDVSIGRANAYESSDQLQITVQAFAGRNPISSVLVNLSAIGGSSAFSLVDDGTGADPVANDGIFNGLFAVSGVAEGRYQLPITVTDSGARTAHQTIVYAKRGAAKRISLSVNALDFGSVYQGLSSEGYFSIMNVSNSASVTISSASSSNSEFAVRIPASFPQTIAPGEVLALRLVFKPNFNPAGSRTGTLTITSDDATSPSRSISLSGTAAAGSGGISPAVTVLGFTAAVGSYQDLYLNITSNGSTPLVLRDVQFDDPCYMLWKPHPGPPRTIDPGITQPLMVRFSPNRTGSINTAMRLITNDPAHQTVSISLIGSGTGTGGCVFTLGSSSGSVPGGGGSGSVTVTAAAGCAWAATSNASWLHVTSGASGSGSGTVGYSADANPDSVQRTGTLTIAGKTFTVTQAEAPPACRHYLDFVSAGYPDAGGMGRVHVTVNQSGCPWSVSSDAGWLTITSATTFAASGSVLYTVAANSTGVTRTGHLTVAGQTYTVTQVAGCSFTINVTSLTVPWQGQGGTIQLTASAASCPWSSYSDQTWAQRYPETGAGTSTIQYTVYPAANTGGRVAYIHIADKTVEVWQSLSPGVEDSRFIDLMYFGFLGRAPSAGERAAQMAALQGGLSRRDLALGLFNTTEFNNAGRFIAGLYVGILGRDAEYAGWLFQRSAFVAGQVTQMQLATNFLNSLEYQMKYGNPTNEEYVRLLYQNVLRRAPTATELATQVALLAGGTSRAQVAMNLLNGAEFRQNSGPKLTAFLLYACTLLRDAEQWERDYWANLMVGGMTVPTVFGYFVNSDEEKIWLQ